MAFKYLLGLSALALVSACDSGTDNSNASGETAATESGDTLLSPSEMSSPMESSTVETIGSAEGSKIGSTEGPIMPGNDLADDDAAAQTTDNSRP